MLNIQRSILNDHLKGKRDVLSFLNGALLCWIWFTEMPKGKINVLIQQLNGTAAP